MAFLSFLFGKKKKNTKNEVGADLGIEETTTPDTDSLGDGSQYIDIANANADICNGVIFCATHQLRTPLAALRKNGEVYTGGGTPPECEMSDGVWLPNIYSEYDLDPFDEQYVASDAGRINSKDYLDYAIAIKALFEESNLSIHEKMNQASSIANTPSRKHIEQCIIGFYQHRESAENFTIEDVMQRFISKEDSLNYFKDKKGYLSLLDGANKTIVSALLKNNIETIEQLFTIDDKELLKIKGIGKVSLAKMRSSMALIN